MRKKRDNYGNYFLEEEVREEIIREFIFWKRRLERRKIIREIIFWKRRLERRDNYGNYLLKEEVREREERELGKLSSGRGD